MAINYEVPQDKKLLFVGLQFGTLHCVFPCVINPVNLLLNDQRLLIVN